MSCFDSKSQFQEAESLMEMFSDDSKRNVMKSRIVSLIFRQLSSRLSLSKNQNNQIVDFMKSMVVFVSPSSEEVSRRFFASHDSCKRQSLNDEARKHLLCKIHG